MKNCFGIICFDKKYDTSLFNNFRIALENYLEIDEFEDIRSINDLENIDYIFIIDEHMTREIWMQTDFINYVNEKKIKVVVFNFEKIYNAKFKSNIEFQKRLEEFKNLYQLNSDIDDAEILCKTVINKQLLSKDSQLNFYTKNTKKDKILFLGQSKQIKWNFKVRNPYYEERHKTLMDFKKIYPNLKISINKSLTYKKYLENIASYKYILNPLGTGNFINIRFYEALELNSIPIQQITDKMQYWYSELDYSIKFTNAKNLNLNDFKFKKYSYYLEDYFQDINLGNLIG